MRYITAVHDSLRELRATEAALLHAAAVHVARARDAAAALTAMGSAEEAEEAAAVPRRSVMDAEEALCCVITNGLVVGHDHGSAFCCTHTERWFATRSRFANTVVRRRCDCCGCQSCAARFGFRHAPFFGPFMFPRFSGGQCIVKVFITTTGWPGHNCFELQVRRQPQPSRHRNSPDNTCTQPQLAVQVIHAEGELGFGGPCGAAGVPAAMYNLASRLNHSCRPTAAYSWHRDTSTIVVRTLVPLAVGDEVRRTGVQCGLVVCLCHGRDRPKQAGGPIIYTLTTSQLLLRLSAAASC